MRRRAWLMLLVLTSVTLITLDAGTQLLQPYARTARKATAAVVTPMQQYTAKLTGSESHSNELQRLRASNARLTAENGLLRSTRPGRPNRAAVQAVGRADLIPARVVIPPGEQAGNGLGNTIQLDVGTDGGVRRGSGVIAPDGLVGRVLRTGSNVSTVLLLTDPRSTVGVRHVDSRRFGLSEGDGANAGLRMVDSDTPLQIGDRLVTWGSPDNSPYPPGIPVGSISHVDQNPGPRNTARLEPAADLAALDRVVVVR